MMVVNECLQGMPNLIMLSVNNVTSLNTLALVGKQESVFWDIDVVTPVFAMILYLDLFSQGV